MKGSDVIVRRSDDLLSTMVDGELIGMSIEKGACYGFDAVATRVWELLEKPCSLDALCGRIVAEFAVSEQECRAQLTEFLAELQRESLVSIRPAE